MQPATEQASFFDHVDYIEVAQRRFPFSHKHSRILGSGQFVIAFKCGAPWKIHCYQTADQRDQAWESYQWKTCGAKHCDFRHDKIDL